MDIERIQAARLKGALHGSHEIALFDVREHGQYGEGHPFLACPLPYSRLELDLPVLAPRLAVPLVFLDDDEHLASRAARRARALGYDDVAILAGGLPAWRAAGYGVFQGVNLPSKTFAEMVEHHYHTPGIGARELHERQRAGEKLAVLDGRTFAEFQAMNIPGAVSCPNGELAYRLRQVVASRQVPIIINCAGRTRSIMGAQTLIQLGISNPVLALRNGTQGWCLEDLPLEHGSTRGGDGLDTPPDTGESRQAVQALLARHPVPVLDAATLGHWWRDPGRSTFCFDVRSAAEFQAGHLAIARHVPGGQLLQTLDQHMGVRNGRIVLVDHDGIRAPVVAYWLAQMGQQVALVPAEQAGRADLATPAPWRPAALPECDAQWLLGAQAARQAQVLDLRGSMDFRLGHIPGAHWTIRPRLPSDLGAAPACVVLVADDPAIAALAATELPPGTRALYLHGGFAAWQKAGLPVATSPKSPADADCIDFLFFVHDRHAGNKEAARRYLAWEMNLVAQLDAQERTLFSFHPHRTDRT